jgi:predicted nucleic acid-binding protein
VRFTLDSNLLVYAVDSTEVARQASAMEIIRRAAYRDCTLLPQALAEFFHATTRKRMLTRTEAARIVDDWMIVFPVAAGAGSDALRLAIREASAGHFQLFDALLLATAHDAGCAAVITEDMGAGSQLTGVRIVPAFSRDDTISAAALALLT